MQPFEHDSLQDQDDPTERDRGAHDRDADRGEGGADDQAEAPAADPTAVRVLAERLLRGLGLDVQAQARDAGPTIEVEVTGPDHEFLLGQQGEALNATQYLLNRIIYRGRRGRKIHVDAGGFRRQREDEVVEIARRTAEKAKAKGEECLLSPLNPYERRLVHLALGEIEGIETRSVGDGFLKRVAIIPSGKRGGKPERDGA
jgi:spoIIIJ-associated protein